MQNCSDKIKEFIRFGIVGTISTAVHYGVYLILLNWINPSISYTAGYAVGFCVNYLLSTYFTFRTKTSIKKAAGFSVSHIINYFLELGVLNLLLWFGMDKQLAGIITLVAVVPVNFILVRTSLKKF